MKVIVLGFWVFLCSVPVSLAQGAPKDDSNRTSKVVGLLAEKTLDVIRNVDTNFVSTLADREGIAIGTDVPTISAARFTKELSEKRGVYCVIFDGSCLENKGRNSGNIVFA